MSFINIQVPPFPYYFFSGNAIYRPGDTHTCRNAGISCFDLIVVEYGCLTVRVGSEIFKVKKNNALIIPPHYPHKGTSICTEKTLFHWLHFQATENYTIEESPVISFTSSTSSFSTNSYRIAIPMYQSLTADNAEAVISLMSRLETQSIDFYSRSSTISKSSTNAFYQQELFMKILQRLSLILNKVSHVEIAYLAMQYMHSHYAENITLETLSKVTNCHPTHLIRCMKKQYNLSPIQALTKIRLNNACILLSEGNLSVTEIAYLTGFSSVSYFGKLFKDAFSCSPKEYRTKKLVPQTYIFSDMDVLENFKDAEES